MQSECRTDPSRSEVVERSRAMPDGEMLVPPAEFPAMFTCLYHDQPATGCVYPVGCVCVMPDEFGYLNPSPCIWNNVRNLEADGRVKDIRWDLCVTRLVGAEPDAVVEGA